MLISFGVYKLSGKLFDSIANDFLSSLVCQFVFAAMALLSVIVLRKTYIFRSDARKLKAGWKSSLLMLVPFTFTGLQALGEIPDFSVTGVEFIMFLIQMFLIGFSEETLFRGLIQNSFHRIFGEDSTIRVYLGVLCGSLCFGGMHLFNAFRPEISFNTALLQAIATFGTGLVFASIYFRTGKNLWFVIFLHALNDVLAFTASGRLSGASAGQAVSTSTSAASAASLDPLHLLYAFCFFSAISLFLLRPSKIRQLQEFDQEQSSGKSMLQMQ